MKKNTILAFYLICATGLNAYQEVPDGFSLARSAGLAKIESVMKNGPVKGSSVNSDELKLLGRIVSASTGRRDAEAELIRYMRIMYTKEGVVENAFHSLSSAAGSRRVVVELCTALYVAKGSVAGFFEYTKLTGRFLDPISEVMELTGSEWFSDDDLLKYEIFSIVSEMNAQRINFYTYGESPAVTLGIFQKFEELVKRYGNNPILGRFFSHYIAEYDSVVKLAQREKYPEGGDSMLEKYFVLIPDYSKSLAARVISENYAESTVFGFGEKLFITSPADFQYLPKSLNILRSGNTQDEAP